MKHLYFVRHGLSVMNKQGVFSGRSETPLAPEGVEQAQAAGRELKDKHIDLIICSPMERAKETAQIIAREIGYDPAAIVVNDLFIERAFGHLEGTTYQPDMEMDHIEGVEKSEEIVARATQGAEFLSEQAAETILVVSHGATGRALRHVFHQEIPFHGSERFMNGAVVKLV